MTGSITCSFRERAKALDSRRLLAPPRQRRSLSPVPGAPTTLRSRAREPPPADVWCGPLALNIETKSVYEPVAFRSAGGATPPMCPSDVPPSRVLGPPDRLSLSLLASRLVLGLSAPRRTVTRPRASRDLHGFRYSEPIGGPRETACTLFSRVCCLPSHLLAPSFLRPLRSVSFIRPNESRPRAGDLQVVS